MGDGARDLHRHAHPAACNAQRFAVEGRKLKCGDQIWTAPLTIHVRLAGAGVAPEDDAPQGAGIVDVDLGRGSFRGAGEMAQRAVRQHHRQAPEPDAVSKLDDGAGRCPLDQVIDGGRADDLAAQAHR